MLSVKFCNFFHISLKQFLLKLFLKVYIFVVSVTKIFLNFSFNLILIGI